MKHFLRFYIFIILLQLNTAAQYDIRVINQKLTAEGLFFDVAIKSTGEEFLLGSYQCIFNFNNTLIDPGQLEFKYIQNTSEISNEPIVIDGIEPDESVFKLCFAAGAGNDIISSEYKRIGSFGLFGNISDQDSINLKWSFSGNIRTIIADYEFNDITAPQNHLIEDNPLPVELISFKADVEKEYVVLKWETATELNSYGFEVQRKQSKEENFIVAGFVKSSGGSANQKYTFKDKEDLNPGKYIYRLKQIDNDGSYEYLQTIEVGLNKQLTYKLYQNYPNPFNPSTNIKYTLKEKSRVELNLFDITGKLITKLYDNTQESGYHSLEWIADNYASGIYICQLRTISIESGEFFSSIIKLILLK